MPWIGSMKFPTCLSRLSSSRTFLCLTNPLSSTGMMALVYPIARRSTEQWSIRLLLAVREHFFSGHDLPHVVCLITYQTPAPSAGRKEPDAPPSVQQVGRPANKKSKRPDPIADLDESSSRKWCRKTISQGLWSA